MAWDVDHGLPYADVERAGQLLANPGRQNYPENDRGKLRKTSIICSITRTPREAAARYDQCSYGSRRAAKSGLSNAENWIFDNNSVERLRYEIDPKWQGEIPVTLLIGSDGSIRRIEGSAKLPEVSTWLNQQQEPQAP